MIVTKHFEYDESKVKATEIIVGGDSDIIYLWMGEFTIQVNLNCKYEEVFKGEDYCVDMSKRVKDVSVFYGGRNEDF